MSGKVKLSDGSHSLMAVGAPSIIMIFVILCLTCFAALSLVSANAELRLASRSGENTAAWYEADAETQRALVKLDALLSQGASKQALTDGGFEATSIDGTDCVRFYTRIGEYTAIETVVETAGGRVGDTLVSRTVITDELEYTQIPFMWDGGEPE